MNSLPIQNHRREIETAIRRNQVVIIAGETGSGKTTRIPQYCLSIGRGEKALIGCTQPRRVAAMTVAERVAEELGSAVGGIVGWQHRFSRRISEQTRLKFMTDGILLAETRHDPDLRRYDTIMLDEAHERTLQIDFLLGYLRSRLQRRRDLKLIISSATLDVAKFSEFFGQAPVLEIPGKLHPVEVRYRPPLDSNEDLATLVADAACGLHAERSGDILVFLPGERDIRASIETLQGRGLPDTDILPFLASLPQAEQRRVFKIIPGRRRIVLATNVAETSLTIPGIRMVVDSGLARISRYIHRSGTQRLQIEPISQASADQRRGRCGRLGPGVCVRLFSEEDYLRRERHTEPEIRRSSLAGVILTMAELRLGRLEEYPLPDPPSSAMIREGYRELSDLQALSKEGRLTKLGRRMARLPLAPRLGRMLLAGDEEKALRDTITIVAALTCDDPRMRPEDLREKADASHAPFRNQLSDFAGLLLLWRQYSETASAGSRSALRKWCVARFLSPRRLAEWADIRRQLETELRRMKLDTASASEGDIALHRALLSGMLSQIGERDPEKNDYRGASGLRFAIHPGSGLFARQPQWVMAAELVDTARLYARRVAAIKPEWIESVGKHLCRRSYHSPYWDARAGTTRALERVTLYGLLISDGKRRDLSRIDPEMSREMFIRHGLIGGELPRALPPPVRHNLKLFEKLRKTGHKQRAGLAESPETLFREAYDRRLPPECSNLPALRAWLRKDTARRSAQLEMSEEDFALETVSGKDFPDKVLLHGGTFRLRYRYAPGSEDDGITCTVPLGALPLLSRWRHDWLVPGALPGKIIWMLGNLPRAEQRLCPASAHSAERLIERMGAPESPLEYALAAALQSEFGVRVEPGALVENLPDPFKIRFSIAETGGREAFATRDITELAEFESELRGHGEDFAQSISDPREKGGLREWSGADLPTEMHFGEAGWPVVNFPAWVDRGDHVALGWFCDRGKALFEHRKGVLRLYLFALEREKPLCSAKLISRQERRALNELGYNPQLLWREALQSAVDCILLKEGTPPPRGKADFEARLAELRGDLVQTAHHHFMKARDVISRATAIEENLAAAELPPETLADLAEQLGWLVFPGFCAHLPPVRLAQFDRYLRGVDMRIERAALNPDRDLERLDLLRPYRDRLTQAAQETAALGPRRQRLLDVYRWAVEEYRVSLFAQELRTPHPVSPLRLDKIWRELSDRPHG